MANQSGTVNMSWLSRLFGSVSHTERLASGAGGFLSIYCTFVITEHYLGTADALLIVPSMGASAVLLFAVPHGPLSQPWNVIGGHFFSAVIGVSSYLLIPDYFTAAAVAVGVAISVMHYTRCIHPPGGATALAAVIGGDATHALGYQFVLTPIMINVCGMLLVAVAFNYFFPWRRYPAWLIRDKDADVASAAAPAQPGIEHADLVAALSHIDSFIDVSEHDLLRIYALATGQAELRQFPPENIRLGHYYSNGEYGEGWSVRMVVDESPSEDPERDMVVYKVVAGTGLRSSGVTTRRELARWAKHELARDDENWKRVDPE